eukprot:COSAG01_NODE_1617_length_9718_cov_267.124545_5_plen_189_part_00
MSALICGVCNLVFFACIGGVCNLVFFICLITAVQSALSRRLPFFFPRPGSTTCHFLMCMVTPKYVMQPVPVMTLSRNCPMYFKPSAHVNPPRSPCISPSLNGPTYLLPFANVNSPRSPCISPSFHGPTYVHLPSATVNSPRSPCSFPFSSGPTYLSPFANVNSPSCAGAERSSPHSATSAARICAFRP